MKVELAMSRFQAYYNLNPISDPNEFLGIAADGIEGQIVATPGKNMIWIINVKTQKTLHSWSTIEKLSTKVVYDFRSEKYIGVFGQHNIRCWDYDTPDVNKVKKLRFTQAIADVICNDKDVYVVYVNGSIELLEQAIETRQKLDENETSELVPNPELFNASITKFPDGRKLFTYFQQVEDQSYLELVCVPLYDSGIPKHYKLKRGDLPVHVVGYTVLETNEGPILWTAWSDYRIFVMSLNDEQTEDNTPGYYVALLPMLKVDKCLAVAGMSNNFVAIYGINSEQEGASLILYNTQYKVVKAKQFFKVHLDNSRIWSDESHIYLAMGQTFSASSFYMTKQLLAELVGVQSDNTYPINVHFEAACEEEDIMDKIKLESECDLVATTPDIRQSKNIVSNKKKPKINIANGKTIAFENGEDFNKTLRDLCELNLHVDVFNSEDNKINMTFMSNFNDKGFSNTTLRNIVNDLECSGASEYEITEKLLTVLIRIDDLAEIANCLRRFYNISEKMLVQTLCYLLNKLILKDYKVQSEQIKKSNVKPKKFIKYSKSEYRHINLLETIPHRKNADDMSEEEVLDLLLSCNFDEKLLMPHINRALDEKQIFLLLNYLYGNLCSREKLCWEERPSSIPECVRFEVQHFRWYGILLNGHFQSLLLSKNEELIQLLFKWQRLFRKYKSDQIEMDSTLSLLYSIVQRGRAYKSQSHGKWYTIDELDFTL